MLILLSAVYSSADSAVQNSGKNPVIIIPGITGSQLINPTTGKAVWFGVKRDKTDDLRLPINSANLVRNRDSLRVGDIIREVELPVLPDVEVYNAVIEALKSRGYTEASWEKPQAADVFYVFPYDWRRDNVEAAQLLMQKIASAKRALRKPDLKFDIIAHSMGGLIARYAAMYGTADLPREGVTPAPTWAGAASIDKLMMFGTPNAGSFGALEVLVNGYPIVAGRNLPLVDDLRPEDVLTSPSIFQLLPHKAAAQFYDEGLKQMNVDLYDIATWEKFGWGAIGDVKFLGKLKDAARLAITNKEIKPTLPGKDASLDDRIISQTTYSQLRTYMITVLSRARRFQAALDAPTSKVPVRLFAYGGNCQPTLSAVVIVRDEKKVRWHTLFDARDIKTSSGSDLKKDELKAIMFRKGDGRVTQSSLLAVSGQVDEIDSTNGHLSLVSSFFSCSSHTKIFLEKPIQDSFLSALVVERQKQP